MEFVVFVWIIAIVLNLSNGVLLYMGQYIVVTTPIKNNRLFFKGLILLGIGLYFYILYSQRIWYALNEFVFPYIHSMGEYQHVLSEVWYTIVFFRNMWPAILIGFIICVIEQIQHPISYRYRMLKRFNHNKLLILVSAGFLYFIARTFSESIATLFLGIIVYITIFYWRFGCAIVLYILRRNKIPYEIGILLMNASVIVSGEYFLLPITMFIGFGISDIWMDYYQRNSASLIFNFDYH